MVGIMCTLIWYLGFMGTFFLNCSVRCLRMIVWTPAVLGVLYACVLYLHLFSAAEPASHGKALEICSLLFIIIITIIIIIRWLGFL